MAEVTVSLWGDVAYPIMFGHRDGSEFEIQGMGGTGFVPVEGVLVTCWHCVKLSATGFDFAIATPPAGALEGVRDIEPDAGGLDLATASVGRRAHPIFNLSPARALSGDNVKAAGFPLPETSRDPATGQVRHFAPARQLKGYIIREFENPNHLGFSRPQPTYELGMPSPGGLSGAPLMIDTLGPVGLRLVGVMYGSNEKEADDAHVTFGWAQTWESVGQLKGKATGGRQLAEMVPQAPTFPS